MSTTYRWNGHGPHVNRDARRQTRRREADERNTCPQRAATRPSCGHNHYDPQHGHIARAKAGAR